MSFKVLVIAEDFTKDEAVLLPLVRRMLEEKGKPNANVQVCRNPNPGGIDTCLNSDWLAKNIVPLYPMVDLFLLFVDRDGDATRSARIAGVEQRVAAELPQEVKFIGESAWQEVEVFILAGMELPDQWKWQNVRADANVKNTYFMDYAKQAGTLQLPHAGRKKLMVEAISMWQRIKDRCPEDIGRLLSRIQV